jgi:CarD family transcriptional regulator
MEFSIGDQIVHPQHGAGQITGVKQLELLENFEHYYVVEIGENGLVVYVPIRKMEEFGVRPVMPRSKLGRVLDTLRSTPRRLSTDFKVRQARIRKKLKTGHTLRIAEVVRDLTWRKRQTHLSQNDSLLLDRGRELLVTELALATNTELTEVHEMINTALASAGMSKTADQQPE